MATLQDVLIDSNAYLDLTAELPTGDDLEQRRRFAMQAVDEWGEAYAWPELQHITAYNATSTTIALPLNTRELVGNPLYDNGGVFAEIPMIKPEQMGSYLPTDIYAYLTGTPTGGLTLVLNNVSSASVSLVLRRYPSNMATYSDVCEVPDTAFVIKTIITYVLQSRSDPRFPQVEAQRQQVLQNMVSRAQVLRGGQSTPTARRGAGAYRIGTRGG